MMESQRNNGYELRTDRGLADRFRPALSVEMLLSIIPDVKAIR
jgi:hypothetical protein